MTLPPGDPDVAAAELALGLLESDDRAAALRRVLADPAFARAVEHWRASFAELHESWPELAPPVGLAARIEATLDRPAAAPPVARAGRLWPGIAAASSLIAASLLMVVLLRPPPPAPPPVRVSVGVPVRVPVRVSVPVPVAAEPAAMLVAAIVPDSGEPLTALYDPASGGLRLTSAALAGGDRSAELWVIAGDKVPHSLGLLQESATTRLAVPAADRARLAAGAVLAISIEPAGGSPTGLPTGPVVAKGPLSRV